MRKLLCFCAGAVLACFSFAGYAELPSTPVPYTFRGHEGLFDDPVGMTLSGNFNLDLQPVVVTNISADGLWTSASYSSPNNTLSGSLGDWTFFGTFMVMVSDGPEWLAPGQDNVAMDHWIIRCSLSGPPVNGWTPHHLNLFFFTFPAGINGVDMRPPHDPLTAFYTNPDDFQFAMVLWDANSQEQVVFGQLLEIRSIPEPRSGALLVLGLGTLWIVQMRMRDTRKLQ